MGPDPVPELEAVGVTAAELGDTIPFLGLGTATAAVTHYSPSTSEGFNPFMAYRIR